VSQTSDYPDDPERELTYRRGYVHGVAATISGLVDLLSDEDRRRVQKWFATILTPWKDGGNESTRPEFPKLS
jgi:hypothetical protein